MFVLVKSGLVFYAFGIHILGFTIQSGIRNLKNFEHMYSGTVFTIYVLMYLSHTSLMFVLVRLISLLYLIE